MKIKRFLAAAAGLTVLVILAVVASACGGVGGIFDHGEMHRQMHGGGSQTPQTPVVSTASEVTVEIRDFNFFARDLTVEAGTAITWVNRDGVPHDATDQSASWGTGMLNQGESATLTFDSPGAYQYICTIHPYMKATLTVESVS